MVNKRQILKQNVEADLRKKIQWTQQTLNRLHGAIKAVEESSIKAKGEVNEAVDNVQKLIGNRKLELTRQIDIICHKQISSLQEDIQATCIALGSLQSTLSNLDTFDHSQLENLSIPSESQLVVGSDPSPLEVKVNNGQQLELQRTLRTFGSVSAKGLNGLLDVGTSTSTSLPQRFVEYAENGVDLMSHKSVLKESQFPFTRSEDNVPTHPRDEQGIKGWLLVVDDEMEDDGFDIVVVDPPTKRKGSDVPEREFSFCESEASSIACVEDTSDLSKWLKPRPRKTLELEAKCNSAFAHNPLKNRFVEFPCLLTDPKSWIPSKKPKPAEFELSSGMFPPEFSLPNVHWLKK